MKDNNFKTTRWIVLVILIVFNWAGKQHLPNIKLKDLNKKRQEISQYYQDGPLLLNFWNLACEPCKKEMKELNKLHLKYEKHGFGVVSINIDNTRNISKVKSYVKSQKYAFTVLLDPRAELFRKMGGKVMPFVIITDSTGGIINRHVGYNPGDEKQLEKEILHLLEIPDIKSDTLLIKTDIDNPEKSSDTPAESTTE